MYDNNQPANKYKEPIWLHGRFVGAGTSVPTAVTNTSKGLTISRSGIGTLTVKCSDLPIGIFQHYHFGVASANANVRGVQVTPPAAGDTSFALQVCVAANGTAVDLASTEELVVNIWCARTQVP